MSNWYDKYKQQDEDLILFDKAAKYSVYEFPTGFAAEAFLTEVGGHPHPRGGIRVILHKGEQEDTPMPKRKDPTLHQYEFLPNLDTIRVKIPNGRVLDINLFITNQRGSHHHSRRASCHPAS